MKKASVFFCVAALLMAGAHAFDAQFKDFEDGTAGSAYDNWGSDGVISNMVNSTAAAGIPGGQTESGNAKVLFVEGSVTNASMFSGMATSTASQLDLLVKVAYPDDELALPSDETSAQIAVGIDTNGHFNVYCRNDNDVEGFYVVDSTVLATDDWIRVSFNFNSSNTRCQVLLNGNLCNSSYGYTDESGTTTGGSWYKLVTTGSTISSMRVVGTTAIDDVYTSQNAGGVTIDDTVVATISGTDTSVKKSWLVSQGLTTNITATTMATDSGTTGMTVIDKYVAGLQVNDGLKFQLSDMQPSTTDASKMVFTFNGSTANGSTFKILGAASPDAGYTEMSADMSASSDMANPISTATIDLGTAMDGATVKYFKVQVAK